MLLVALILALGPDTATAPTPVQTIVLERNAVRLVCPVGSTTRLLFPEAKRRLISDTTPSPDIQIRGLQTRPRAEIAVRPTGTGRTVLTFEGDSGTTLTVEIEAVEATSPTPDGLQVRLELPPAQPVPATTGDAPDASGVPRVNEVTPSSLPVPTPSTAPAAAAVSQPGGTTITPPGLVDIDDLITATPRQINRRVTVAGHPALIAEVMHVGTRWTWARLRLRGGADRHIASLSWQRGKQSGQVPHWRAEPDGPDLRITLQLPPGDDERARLSLQVLGGARYDFPLDRTGLGDIKDRLF